MHAYLGVACVGDGGVVGGVAVAVLLGGVSHHGQLKLLFELAHQQARTGGPGEHLRRATHGTAGGVHGGEAPPCLPLTTRSSPEA